MLRLKALGGLVVLREGSALKGAATQRRRLALLAIVATAGKKGISRDRLLTLLWPESDETKGRHGLAQSLYALKRDLGDDSLFVGTSELRLNPDVITSDVQDFRDAIVAGNHCAAASLYGGPLLDGVYISGAPDFERWLDSEREHLAREFSEVLENLAAQQTDSGDVASSSATLARLAGLDPLNTRVVIKTMKSLAYAGDVSGALALAARHEAGRRDELDLPGDPEVVTLRDEITQSERDRTERILSVSPIRVKQTESVAGDEAGTLPAKRVNHLRKRAAGYWAAGASAVLIAGTLIAQHVAAGTFEPVESRLVVLPFEVRGNAGLSYLKDGIVDLLSERLDGAGTNHTVDPNAVLEFVRSEKNEKSETMVGRKATARFGAGRFVMGSIVDAGGRIRISATVYNADGKRISVADATAADENHLLPLIDDLARGLVGGDLSDSGARLGREAALTTTSLPALKWFLAGEQEFRAAHFPAAVESYEKAVALDSTFALAWYRLSTAGEWSSQSKLVSDATKAAVHFESRLSPEERMLLDARMAALKGNDDDVERLYSTILAAHPEDAEAWTQLGETIFHNGGWRGRPIDESRAAFERVAALRSNDVAPKIHLARLAALRGDRVALDTIIPSALQRAKDAEQIVELKTLSALGSGDGVRKQQFLDSLERVPTGTSLADGPILLAAWRAATFTTDPSSSERLALIVARPGNSASTRLSGLLAAAHMAAARGRWSDAKALLASAERLDHSAAVRTMSNLASTTLFPVTPAELRSLVAQLKIASPARTNGNAPKLIDATLVGRLAVMLGDSITMKESAAALENLVHRDTSFALIGYHLRNQLVARASLAAGNRSRAVELVEAGWPSANPQSQYPWLQSESYTMASGRFARARLLDESGRVADALPWYETIAEDQGYSTVYLAPSYLRRAVAEEKLGRRAAAAEHYKRFISLWRDADPALQPQVRFAKERLARLSQRV
jgi:DNA-binding SARP family transcriptional activator/TolB-like protein